MALGEHHLVVTDMSSGALPYLNLRSVDLSGIGRQAKARGGPCQPEQRALRRGNYGEALMGSVLQESPGPGLRESLLCAFGLILCRQSNVGCPTRGVPGIVDGVRKGRHSFRF
ncbi:hypothetical protein StoSoilA2_20070 [Arthrobacter sp. StoSoilA2]|nr:hypothetical protein StoSoilA2_20070 [Arthrobacter sp. StoSoilA2]